MTTWHCLFAGAVLSGCSVIASYPDVEPEDSGCNDGADNDLDGETDCADLDCQDLCPDRTTIMPVMLECPTVGFVAEPPEGTAEACVLSQCAVGRRLRAIETCECPSSPPDGAVVVTPETLREELAGQAAVLALAAGSYAGPIVIHRPVVLRGDCGGETIIEAPGSSGPAVRIDARDVTLQELTVTGAGGPGIALTDGAEAELLGVAVQDVQGAGIEVGAAALVARRVAITGVSGVGAAGLRVGPGGRVTLDGVLVESGAATAITIDCGGDGTGEPCLEADHLLVREEAGEAAGIDLRSGSIELRRTTIERTVGHGLLLHAGRAVLEDVVIRNVRKEGEPQGTGIEVRAAATVMAHRLRLRNNLFHGIVVSGTDATVVLNDLELLGEQPSGTDGIGLLLQGGDVVLMSFVIDNAGRCGIRLEGAPGFSGTNGVIAEATRGACVASTSVTIAQLTSSITYVDNGQNIVVE